MFPPDKEDKGDQEEAIISAGVPGPARPLTSPVRRRVRPGPGSSSGSEDGRSSLATPSLSLHHSYETLNMSEPGLGLSQPHRPAPKPPALDPGELSTERSQWCRDKRTRLIRLFDH